MPFFTASSVEGEMVTVLTGSVLPTARTSALS